MRYRSSTQRLVRQNVSVARALYQGITKSQLTVLRDLTAALKLSIRKGELLHIEGKWYVSHSGLILIAHRRRCCGIETNVEQQMTDASVGRWVFRAVVHKSPSRTFTSATVVAIRPMCPTWSVAPKCEWPRREQ